MSDKPSATNGSPLQKRFLSQRMAQRCEDACEPVCRCRCGGAKHGAKRGTGASFLNTLPEDDPHFVPTVEWKKAKKKAKKDAAWKRRLDILMGVQP